MDPTVLNDPGRTLRLRLAHARPRDRQGARTRYAAAADEIRIAIDHLTTELGRKKPRAILDTVALLAGVNESDVRHISVGSKPDADARSIHLDIKAGLLWTDLEHIVLPDAARPVKEEMVLDSSWWSAKPLPLELARAIADTTPPNPSVVELGSIFQVPLRARGISLTGDGLGRLRPTLSRLQHGLAHLLASQHVDPLVAAVVLNQFHLIPRARLYYVAVDSAAITEACGALYRSIGWDVGSTGELPAAFGSRVVPTDTTVTTAWIALRTAAEALLPARRYTLQQVIDHDNAYARAAGWWVSFLTGARESVRLDFRATSCRPGASYVVYRDKQTGPFLQPRPVLLCGEAQLQVRHYYAHLRSLAQRAEHLQVKAPWLSHVKDVLAFKNNYLLFQISGAVALPLGSRDLLRDVPTELRLLENSGRHFWQTALHKAGVRSDIVDVFARHAARGTESMTSTSTLPLITAHQIVSAVQSATLKRIGMEPLQGLGRRSTPCPI